MTTKAELAGVHGLDFDRRRDRLPVACGKARFSAWAALIGLLAFALPAAAFAQSPSAENTVPTASLGAEAEIAAERETLFRAILADPANLDLAYRYAALSAEAGDLEAAIATLERMLIFAPGLPRLQLELGVLYFRLGADERARSYFEAALSADSVPVEVSERVEPFLARIDERLEVDRFSGSVLIGGRYQTNATSAPATREVSLNGIDFLLDEASIADDDVSGFASVALDYSRDLLTQGDRLEVGVLGYGSLYLDNSAFNAGVLEITAGPSFNLDRFRFEDTRLGLYAIASGIILRDDPYLLSGGIGSYLSKTFDARTRGLMRAEYRRETFKDSPTRPRASDRTGDRYRLQASLERRLTARVSLFGTAVAERRDADVDYLSLFEIGGTLGGAVYFDAPLEFFDEPWRLTLTGGYARREYDSADPVFSARDAQNDDEFTAQLQLDVPVADETSLRTALTHRSVGSNYALRDYDDTSVSLALQYRF